MPTPLAKRTRFKGWLYSRGLTLVAYVALFASSVYTYAQVSGEVGSIDKFVAAIAGVVSAILVVSGVASAHAVSYNLRPGNVFLVKLELPSLRALAGVFILHGVFSISAHHPAQGTLQLGVAALLLHEMRWLAVLRKGDNGRLI